MDPNSWKEKGKRDTCRLNLDYLSRGGRCVVVGATNVVNGGVHDDVYVNFSVVEVAEHGDPAHETVLIGNDKAGFEAISVPYPKDLVGR